MKLFSAEAQYSLLGVKIYQTCRDLSMAF